MIRMSVRDKKIRPVEIDAEFPQGRPHDLDTFRPVHPGVDHEAPIRASNHVGIDGPQRVPGERDLDAVYVWKDLFHLSSLLWMRCAREGDVGARPRPRS